MNKKLLDFMLVFSVMNVASTWLWLTTIISSYNTNWSTLLTFNEAYELWIELPVLIVMTIFNLIILRKLYTGEIEIKIKWE